MNVTIIGSGNMARGIGTRLVSVGHSVTLVDVNPETAEKAAEALRGAAKKGAQVSTASMDNVEIGEIVILALWYGANIEAVKQLGNRLAGKIVVDIANPMNSTFDGLATAPDSSSAEDVAKVAPAAAKVIKAFNTTFAGTLLAGQVAGQPLDVFIAGDDADAKSKFAQLIKDSGLRVIDTGPLNRARQLEGIGLLHITLQGTLGTNWGSAVKIIA
ncbi:MAG: NAD(P)-binding domain-containing protein [Chloroflexi bacterium]|nr:NAD(P)-binding domain-containing protein [Chloroflexota bacterium]